MALQIIKHILLFNIGSKILFSTIVFILTMGLNGCKTKQGPPNIFISGTIMNTKSDEVVLYSRINVDTLFLNKKNTIKSKFFAFKGQYYKLIDGKNSLEIFLQPGDSLYFEYDFEDLFGSLKFGGTNTTLNGYLANRQYNFLQSWQNITHLVSRKPNSFTQYVDSIYEYQNLELLRLKTAFYDTLNAFFNLEQTSLHYSQSEKLLEYVMLSPNAHLIKNNTYFSFLDNVVLEDTNMLSLPAFQSFLYTYIDWLAYNQIANKEDLSAAEITLTKMQVISRNFETGIIKDELLYNTLNNHLRFYGLSDTENLFKTFKFQCENAQLKSQLLNPYKEYLALNNGGIAPAFSCKNAVGDIVYLSDFMGSYVCIDVWATWCTPCLRETPYFEDLQNKYKHKNVVFMSISLDDAEEKWAKYCLMNNKTQHQYWMLDKKEFTDNYMIKTIPHFIIIDNKGRIINANAPRPSENNNGWLNNLPNKKVL